MNLGDTYEIIYINQRDCISDSLISSGDPGVQPADTTSSAEIKNDPLDPIFDVDHDSGLRIGCYDRDLSSFCKSLQPAPPSTSRESVLTHEFES